MYIKQIQPWCCSKQIKPLFDDIKEKDFAEPLKRLNNPYLNEYITKEPNDVMINYYIKSVRDIFIISIFPKALKQENNMDKLLDKLKSNGDIYYIKDISVNFYTMYNIIYQYYSHEKRMKSNPNILFKLNKLGFTEVNQSHNLKIIVYKHKNKEMPLGGNSSVFKMELRELFTLHKDDSYYDFLHVNNDDNEAYEYSNIFFNKNTFRFLEKQQSWKLIDMNKTIRLFNRLKEFLYNFSLIEVENAMVFSSGILFAYGLREINDLDVIMLESKNINTKQIEDFNNDKKFDLDISYEKSNSFNEEWIKELNIRASMCGAKDYRELILNPSFHFYYMGLKFLRLKCDIFTRIKRGRPAQITDLLILRQILNLNYELSIPKEIKMYNEKEKKDIVKKVDENEFLRTVKHYLKTRYYIDISIENIKKWINNDLSGGNNSLLIKQDDVSNNKYVYPTMEELIKMGFIPKVIIYSSVKPYLYEGENFPNINSLFYCSNNDYSHELKQKNNALRIMTFNIHNLITRCNQGIVPIFGNALNPFEKPKDINRFIKFFNASNADILCLQELVPVSNINIEKDISDYEYIRNNFNFDYFNELMEKIGYKYKIISSTMNGYFIENEKRHYYFLGNAIYSKIPLNNSQIYQYTFLNRNFITTSIKYMNQTINIVNCHWEYYKDKNLLILQSEQLYNKLKELYNMRNIILCGDFNINLFNKKPGPRYIDWEQRTLFIKQNFMNTSKQNRPTNFSQHDTTDYILLSKNSNIKIKYSSIVHTNISDHFPIYTDFILYH